MSDFWSLPKVHNDRIAIVDLSGNLITYGALRELAGAWSDRLLAAADGHKPLVALDFVTSADAIAAYLGALRSGLPILVVEPGQLAYGTRMANVWQPELHIASGPDGTLSVFDNLQDKINHADAWNMPHPELALLLSTSGSTGDPKLVRLSHKNISSNAAAIADYLMITPADRAITTLPLFYSYGLSVLNSHLFAGAALILNKRSVTDTAFWQDVLSSNVTSMALVPHQFSLLEKSGFDGAGTQQLRYITQAGGRLDRKSVRHFHTMGQAAGWDLVLMYGQTEASPRISYVPVTALPEAADTIGIPVPGGRIRLLDAQGTEITDNNKPGELIYDGPNVMMGYAENRNDLGSNAESSDLRTGDIAERTDQGFYRIVGRMKRFVKIAGLRLSLDQIEALLHDQGIGVQAVAVDDRLVLLHTGVDTSDMAREIVADACGLPLAEIHVGVLAELPTLASGKPDHKALRQIAVEVLVKQDNRPTSEGHSLAETLKLATRARRVGPDDSFTSLGGDSLSYLQMQMALEERLGTVPPRWEVMPLAQLEAMVVDTSKRSVRSRVSVDVLLRVFAITLVIVQHATSYPVTGGVWILIALMGYSAARFQMQSIVEGQALRLGMRMLYPILPLYYLLLITYHIFRDDVPILYFLLLGEYEIIEGKLLTVYWFVSFYSKVVAVLMFCAAFSPARGLLIRHPWAFPAVATIFLLVIQILLLISGDYVVNGVSSWPYTHFTTRGFIECLPFFFLGWMIHHMKGRRQVFITVVTLAIILLIFWQFEVPYITILLLTFSLALLTLNPEISFPIRTARLLQTLASITLFVYLLHQIVITPTYGTALPDWAKAIFAFFLSFVMAWLAKIAFDRLDGALSRTISKFR